METIAHATIQDLKICAKESTSTPQRTYSSTSAHRTLLRGYSCATLTWGSFGMRCSAIPASSPPTPLIAANPKRVAPPACTAARRMSMLFYAVYVREADPPLPAENQNRTKKLPQNILFRQSRKRYWLQWRQKRFRCCSGINSGGSPLSFSDMMSPTGSLAASQCRL